MRVFLLIIFLAAKLTNAVTRSDFRTCADSPFCTRQRKTIPGETTFFADFDRLNESQPYEFEFPLKQDREDVELLVRLSCLADSTFRLQISEKDHHIQRYSPLEALKDKNLKVRSCVLAEKTPSKIVIRSEQDQVIVYGYPFTISIIRGDKTIFTVNSEGFLKFETFTEVDKIPNSKTTSEGAENMTANDDNDQIDDAKVPHSCEERFNNHVDKNPLCHQSIGVDITFLNTEHVFGIPEHADSFSLKSTANTDPYRLHNMDVFEYELNNPMALYGSVPYMLSHSVDETNGVFWLNAAETWVEILSTKDEPTIQYMMRRIKHYFKKPTDDIQVKRVQTRWMSETGKLDVFFMLGPGPYDVFTQYSRLTGTTQLPPLFSLGFHQSRWNYFSSMEVLSLLDKFEEFELPLDVIWLDIEHTDGRRYFTWNRDKFPDPVNMTETLVKLGRKLVTIIDPHIKVDESYDVYKQIREQNFAIKQSDGHSNFEGNCWPGLSIYIDFINPAARDWYEKMLALDKYEGSTLDTFVWNDMNEPSVFSGVEVTAPKDVVHFGGWENRAVHNIYGFLQHLSTARGLAMRSNNTLRPFTLSRSFFAGSQRAGAIWTGDNTNSWEHMKMSIPMLLSLSVTGISFCGADVGGFFDSSKETELFVRWYQLGAMLPFFRVHSHIESIRREPWAFGQESMDIIEQALRLRYSMLPIWYTLFYENELTGIPPMRPLWSVFPSDSSVIETETSFMIGEQILVSPVLERKTTKMNIYLPGLYEVWYDEELLPFEGGEEHSTQIYATSIPRFQRGGTVIALKERKRRSAQAMINDPYTLVIALDKKNEANGTLFMDDGQSFNYQNERKFYYRNISMANNTITSRLIDGSKNFKTREWIERIRIAGYARKPSKILLISENDDNYERPKLEAKQLFFEYNAERKILLIRRPGVNANKDWKIEMFQ